MHSLKMMLNDAISHHLQGNLSEAETLYREILEIDPRQPQALSMLGMILMSGSHKAEAEALFARHLSVESNDPMTLLNLGRLLQAKGEDNEAVSLLRQACSGMPVLAPIYNDLAVSLHRLGKCHEALAAVDRALSIDPNFGVAHDNRGIVLHDCDRFMEAVAAYERALAYTPDQAVPERIAILLNLVRSAYEAKEFKTVENACRTALDMDQDNAAGNEYLAKALYRMRRHSEAVALLNRRTRARGLVKVQRTAHPESTILVLGGVGASHVPTSDLFDPSLFATMTLTLVSPDQPDAPFGGVSLEEISGADLVFNTLGEVEQDGGQIESVKNLLELLGKPALNPPGLVARTGRNQSKVLFGDIPGLRVPDVNWLMRDEMIDFDSGVKPFLVRPAGVHGGEDLALIASATDWRNYLAKVPHDRFIRTDFHDFKDAQGCYRKYRFIFVDRRPYPCHLAIADDWLVHYWRSHMNQSEWKMREEERFVADWRGVFGPGAVSAVEQVARRLNLDYGGMDCSILADGEVLFFEANATMLVCLDEQRTGFPNKYAAGIRIRDAVTDMVRNRLSRHG